MASLRTLLGIAAHDASPTIERAASITDFLSRLFETIKDAGWEEALKQTSVVADALVTTATTSLPLVNFLVALTREVRASADPDVQLYLACTLAYQRAALEALSDSDVKAAGFHAGLLEFRDATDPDLVDVRTFSLSSPFAQPFFHRADALLARFAAAVRFDPPATRRLLATTHRRFLSALHELLRADEFKILRERVGNASELERAMTALERHAAYENAKFTVQRSMKVEPFTLQDIYLDTECGAVRWGEIREALSDSTPPSRPDEVDLFLERTGGRRPLVGTVMELVGDPAFKDVIIIQGPPGAGKSAFTLKLVDELLSEGLRPIRVRLTKVRFDRSVNEAISAAIAFGPDYDSQYRTGKSKFFADGGLFTETVMFDRAEICPYVLILDGWDEIGVGGGESLKERLATFLEGVREEFLSSDVRIRVVLTGRPTEHIYERTFLRDSSVILSVRPLQPHQVQSFTEELISRWVSDVRRRGELLARCTPIFAAYTTAFERWAGLAMAVDDEDVRPLEVLGFPLLAFLAVKSVVSGGATPESFLDNPTELYRRLIDMTASAWPGADEEPAESAARKRGVELRRLLHATAVAITTYGLEHIDERELAARMEATAAKVRTDAIAATAGNTLTDLIISYYFKSGPAGKGCEFFHKSFREYLFAEAVIEELKRFGSRAEPIEQQRSYWKDFEAGGPLHDFSRRLAGALSPQWVTLQIGTHLENLMAWEISRGASTDAATVRSDGLLTPQQWSTVADGLSELWRWWCDGRHLRPQPKGRRHTQPYVVDLAVDAAPRKTPPTAIAGPRRVITVDAHLGDALFRLTAAVIGTLRAAGLDIAPFKPAPPEYWPRYVSRIAAVGKRPAGEFPQAIRIRHADLSRLTLNGSWIARRAEKCSLADSTLTHCGPVSLSRLLTNQLSGAVLREPAVIDDASDISLPNVAFVHADFSNRRLTNVHFDGGRLVSCDFRGAVLQGCTFRNVVFERTSFEGANVAEDTRFIGCSPQGNR